MICACGCGQEIIPNFFALHELDKDRHALVVILQALAAAVEQRIGIEDAGIDTLDGQGELVQVILQVALVGAKQAFIFTGKGGTEVVFQ